jgi:membrane protease YdiL (CAAX protease family)
MALPPLTRQRTRARGVCWPFDHLHPLALLATVLATLAVLVFTFLFVVEQDTFADSATTPDPLQLDDPIRSLAKLSHAERLITQAAKGLPRWIQEWTVGTPDGARADAERRWGDLVAQYEIAIPSEAHVAALARAAILAEWGDAEALEQIRCAPPDQLDELPPEMRDRVDATLTSRVESGPAVRARTALTCFLAHEALFYVLMVLGAVAVGWWAIRGQPSVPLGTHPATGSFGLLRGYELWIWCKLIPIAACLLLYALDPFSLFLGDVSWEIIAASTTVATLLLVHYWLLRPQGRTLLALYTVPRGRGLRLVLVALVVLGFCWMQWWIISYLTPATGGTTGWTGWVDEPAQSGRTWLWLVDSLNTIIGAPVVEELVYRGVLYAALRARFSVVQAAVMSAVVFSGVHGYGLTASMDVMLSGFVYALTYEYTRSLAPCVLAHALHNLSAVAGPLPFNLM